ncbi:aspartate carbamoyltransferase regulatory subunit [Methanolobus vulcani]|jgi:aspartate carbamoyltransferase regulatory subunit|uniref:Aspartate carbamoyltransferase regulatory chain n=1 Tax=Methanolobus vulcani TaxID=38026 RepID=A0A7Z8KP21_9EURY|nr:aspartate carbamoyltransferase regulatory subunit [Methanolobus vulcani]TQD24926.1 aspartate carbamoyltransferase regulatory subunit [Methanolobus vulcani]
MTDIETELRVRRIENGTVIDHITAGKALNVLKILGLPDSSEGVVSVLINSSGKYGRKDVVKVENRELNVEEVDKIALISPNATINIIRNFNIVNKYKVHIPSHVEGVVSCINPNCISNSNEPITSKFTVDTENIFLKLRCYYCGRVISEDIAEHLL